MAPPIAPLAALLALTTAGAALARPAHAFDPAAEQARQVAAVGALQDASERRAAEEQAHARDAAAKPGDAEAARKAAEARAQTPEGRLEAQAEAARDAAQPGVTARASALRRSLAVQPDPTGAVQAVRVAAAERQARSEARRMSARGLPPR